MALKVLRRPAAVPRPAVAAAPLLASCAPAPAARRVRQTSWQKLGKIAMGMRRVYHKGCAFPLWSAELLESGGLEPYVRSAVVYYKEGDDLATVKRLTQQREPANVCMYRCYDEDLLESRFGYRHGAYSESTKRALMPNIAIYCRTPMRLATGEQVTVHVVNAIGYAFDTPAQPDYRYFFPLHSDPGKWKELVARMSQMWRFIFECARRQGLKRVHLADVGGGNFSLGLEKSPRTSYAALKEQSLGPVLKEYAGEVEMQQLQRIPDWAFTAKARPILAESLLVNAWDPWCMVGNGNDKDNSLDGFFGRCTAMALLCWPLTNPFLRWESVKVPDGAAA